MAIINIHTEIKAKAQQIAQQIFESLGLDISTSINIFLRQTVRKNDLSFVVTARPCPAQIEPESWWIGVTGRDIDKMLARGRHYDR